VGRAQGGVGGKTPSPPPPPPRRGKRGGRFRFSQKHSHLREGGDGTNLGSALFPGAGRRGEGLGEGGQQVVGVGACGRSVCPSGRFLFSPLKPTGVLSPISSIAPNEGGFSRGPQCVQPTLGGPAFDEAKKTGQ